MGQEYVYQGRLKRFPIQDDDHYFVVSRFVERNAARANLAVRMEDWKSGSLFRWLTEPEPVPKLLSPWPLPRLPNWANRVNEPIGDKELEAVHWSVKRSSLFGNETLIESTFRRLDLESTLRPRGRPQVSFLPQPQINDS